MRALAPNGRTALDVGVGLIDGQNAVLTRSGEARPTARYTSRVRARGRTTAEMPWTPGRIRVRGRDVFPTRRGRRPTGGSPDLASTMGNLLYGFSRSIRVPASGGGGGDRARGPYGDARSRRTDSSLRTTPSNPSGSSTVRKTDVYLSDGPLLRAVTPPPRNARSTDRWTTRYLPFFSTYSTVPLNYSANCTCYTWSLFQRI